MGLGGLVLGFPLLYLKGMRIMMFQLSGFYCRWVCNGWGSGSETLTPETPVRGLNG